MTGPVDVLDEIEKSGAVMHGHFLFTSGLHSPTYMNKAILLMDPQRAARVAIPLAARLSLMAGKTPGGKPKIDAVVSSAVGAVILGHEVAKRLGCAAYYLEKVRGGGFANKRGFPLKAGMVTVVVDDVVTTGTSLINMVLAVQATGATVVSAGCLVDRSIEPIQISSIGLQDFSALVRMEAPTYRANQVPEALREIPLVRMGSDV